MNAFDGIGNPSHVEKRHFLTKARLVNSRQYHVAHDRRVGSRSFWMPRGDIAHVANVVDAVEQLPAFRQLDVPRNVDQESLAVALRVRSFLGLLLVALYATLSTCGHTLHFLPGCNHAHHSLESAGHEDSDCCGKSHHDCEQAPPDRQPPAHLPSHDHDDCLICQHFAQGQTVAVEAQLTLDGFVQRDCSSFEPVRAHFFPQRTQRPRAPPSLLPAVV